MFTIEQTKLIKYLVTERISDMEELIELSDDCDIKGLQHEQKLLNKTYEVLTNIIHYKK